MQPKNTIKFIVSLVVVAVFVTALTASRPGDGDLKSPTLSAAVNFSNLPSIQPVEPISSINPTIVGTLTPTLRASAEPGLFYVFSVFNMTGDTPSDTPLITSPYIPSPKTDSKVSFTVTRSLTDGSTYAWTAKACADAQGSRCSDPAPFSYMKVMLSTATDRPGSILLPTLFSTDSNGNVLMFDTASNNWVPVSSGTSNIISSPCTDQFGFPGTLNPSGGCDPIAADRMIDLPTIYATLDNGSVVKFDGSNWVPVSSGTTLGTIGTAIGNVFNTIGDVASGVIGAIINLFSPTPAPVLPTIYSTDSNGNVSKFDTTSNTWVVVSSSAVPSATSNLPTIYSTDANGNVTMFDGNTWVPVSGTSSIISSPCTDQFGFPGTLNPSGGCDPIASQTSTSNTPLFYASDSQGTTYQFDNNTKTWTPIGGTSPVEPEPVPLPTPVPTKGIRSVPLINSILNIFN